MTRVIHIRNWNPSNPDHIYIGRAGKALPGPFGNPVRVGYPCICCGQVHLTAGSTLPCYEAWLKGRLASDAAFREAVAGLHNRVLVCFCKPGPCHGDVLASYAQMLRGPRLEPGAAP